MSSLLTELRRLSVSVFVTVVQHVGGAMVAVNGCVGTINTFFHCLEDRTIGSQMRESLGALFGKWQQ